MGGAEHSRVTPRYNEENSCCLLVGSVVTFGGEPLPGTFDLGLGLGTADEVGPLDELARLEVLVVHKEVLNRFEFEARDVGEIGDVIPARVAGRNADHFVVAAGVVDLVVRSGGGWTVRRIPLTDIRQAVVQVEFSPPSAAELELVGGTPDTEARA